MNELMKTAVWLCDMDGVSGYEDDVRRQIKDNIKQYSEQIIEDSLGNLLVFVRGEKKRRKPVLLCAHMDEIGAIVFRISEEGLLYIKAIGTVDPRVLLGKRVYVGNKKLLGVVGAKAVQMSTPAEKSSAPGFDAIYVDIGAKSKEDALRYVNIGDPITFTGESIFFGDQRFMAKAIDDRLLCAVLIDALRKPLPYDTWFAFTTCEEVGLRGAAVMTERIKPQYAMILEGTSAADFPGVKPHLAATRQGKGAVVSIVDRGTFYNEKMITQMTSAANRLGIKWQYRTTINGRTDSGAISIRNGGTVTFGISLPTRYNHSQVSHVYWPDVEQLCAFVQLFIEQTGEMDL